MQTPRVAQEEAGQGPCTQPSQKAILCFRDSCLRLRAVEEGQDFLSWGMTGVLLSVPWFLPVPPALLEMLSLIC